MLDVIQRVLTWLLTIEIVGFLAASLGALGIPPMLSVLLVMVGMLFAIHKFTSDRYMFQRWKRKINGWLQR